MAADSGNGATIAHTAGTFIASIINIQPGSRARPALDVSHLGTSDDREFIPGDLFDNSEWTVTYIQDITDSDKTVPPEAVETWTVTYPEQTGAGVAPTYAGTAFITSHTMAELANDTVQVGQFTLKWDGATGPAFTQDT